MSALADIVTWFMEQVGYAICHQMPSRSLAFGGRHLTVCARDTGLFLGFAVCFLALLALFRLRRARYPSWPKILLLVLMLLPTVVDAVSSYPGLRESNNIVRLSTGALAGAAAAALLFPLAVRQWSREEGTAFESWWSLAVPPAAAAVVTAAVYPGWTGGYWLWAPLVTIAILFTFLVLNVTLVCLVVEWLRGGEGPRLRPAPALVIGAGLAVLELAASNGLHHIFA